VWESAIEPTHTTYPVAMVQESTAIAYPDLSSGHYAGESDQHDGAFPNVLTYFRTDLDAVRPYAFAQVTVLRLRAVTDSPSPQFGSLRVHEQTPTHEDYGRLTVRSE
jgi:hypothetical protein